MECDRNDMLRKRGGLLKLRCLRKMMVAVRLENWYAYADYRVIRSRAVDRGVRVR
jgi:hypothetical protein